MSDLYRLFRKLVLPGTVAKDEIYFVAGAPGECAMYVVGNTTRQVIGGAGGGGGSASWGGITGTLTAQADLVAALGAKQPLTAVLTNTTASYTTAEQAKLAAIAVGATVNSADAFLLARANHTGTQAAATITGLAAIATSGSAADLSAGVLPAARFDDTAHGSRAGGALHSNVIAAGASGFMTGADKTKLDGIASGAQVNVATDLTYTAASRLLASSTGTDATLPLVTSSDAGLAPATGGGTTNFLRADGTWALPPGGGGGAAWGGITGTLSAQTDLQAALDGKQPIDADLTTIAGLTATTDNFLQSKAGAWASRTVAQVKTDLGLTGTNSGDQTITLTGDITGSGTGSFATSIATNAVVLGKMAQVATSTFLGRVTASTGNVESLSVAQAKTVLAYTPADIGAATSAQANATHTGDATGTTALTLATVNANVGSWGLAGSVAQFTVNAKGLITAAANVAISIASTAISDSTAAGRAFLTAATAAAQTALLDVFTSGANGLAPASGGGTTNFLRADGTWAAAGGGSPVTVQDEGVNVTTALGTLNFVGAGVTVTGGATATVTIPGGGGGVDYGATISVACKIFIS